MLHAFIKNPVFHEKKHKETSNNFIFADHMLYYRLAKTPERIKSMTKRDLVVRIAAESGLIQSQVAEIVQKTLDYIADELADGRTVELRNFGIFDVVTRRARPGRN